LTQKKRIGVISVENDDNPGNNLVKIAMSQKLKELGFDPTIIAITNKNYNLSFLKNIVKLKEIKNSFSELNKDDYDILMVNSDQTWTFSERRIFYDVAFLQFAENWNITKFVYGASLGGSNWFFNKKDDIKAKYLLRDFKGISLREKMMIPLAKEHLNIDASFVLDPTFLIDKSYYLNLIKDYNKDFDLNKKCLFVHLLYENKEISEIVKEAKEKFNYIIYNSTNKDTYKDGDFVQNFLFGINNCQSVITDSYYGIIFSIIFNKPFLSYMNSNGGGEGKFISLKETFDLSNRIIHQEELSKNLNLLANPLNISQVSLDSLKQSSTDFLKRCLGI